MSIHVLLILSKLPPMSSKKKALGIFIALAGLLAAWLYFGINWDERAVRNQLTELVELVEKDGPVSQFEALGRSRKFKELFVAGALIEYMPGKALPRGTDAIQTGFLSVWGQIETASIRISQHKVDLGSNEAEASSTFYAKCRVVINGSERMGDTVFYRTYWVKRDGDWLVDRIIAERSERPPLPFVTIMKSSSHLFRL